MKKFKDWIVNNFDKIGYFVMAAYFIVFHVILYLRMDMIIDSDLSSEMVYAQLCANENALLTNSWFYSTELKVFSMNIVLTPLFKFLGNWKLIRLIGTVICNGLIVAGFIYLGKQLKLKYLGWLSILVVGSVSEEYYRFITSSMCYSVFIISSLFSLALIVKLYDNHKNTPAWFLLGLLTFLTSLNGMRMLVVFSLPVFVSAGLLWLFNHFVVKNDNNKGDLVFVLKMAVFVLLISLAGYLVNVEVLSKIYVFESYTNINFGLDFSRLSEVIYGWLKVFGLVPAMYFTSIKYLMMALFVGFVLMIFASIVIVITGKKYNLKERFIALTFLMSCCAISAVFVISDQYYVPRYLLPSFALYGIVIAICLNKTDFKFNKIIVCLLAGFVSINSASLSLTYGNNKNLELKEAIEILNSDDIDKIYASFWEGNVLTELCNGEIETYVLEKDTHKINRWLQKQDHYNNSVIDGKVYLVFDEKYKRDLSSTADEFIVYQGDEVVMYCFDSYEQMISQFVV